MAINGSDFIVNVGLEASPPDISNLIKQVQDGFDSNKIKVKLDVGSASSQVKSTANAVKSAFNSVTSTSYKNFFKEFSDGFTKKSPELQKVAAYYKQAAKEADAFAAANNKVSAFSGKDFFKNFDAQFQKSPDLQKMSEYYKRVAKEANAFVAANNKINTSSGGSFFKDFDAQFKKSPELQKMASYYAELEKSYTSLMATYSKYNATGYMDALKGSIDNMLPRANVEQANEAKTAFEGLQDALGSINNTSGGASNATTEQLQALADAGKQAEVAISNLSKADSVTKSQLAQDSHRKRATNTLQNYFNKYKDNILKNSDLTNRFNQIMSDIGADKYKGNWNQLSNDIAQYQRDCQAAGIETQSLTQKLQKLFGQHLSTAVAMLGVNALRQSLRQVYQNVVELDKAMLELRKVTDEADATYEKFFQNATVRAQALGATLADTINASADFARLGYGLNDSAALADAALVYKNVGDGISDISESSESIISSMKAFGIEASNAMSIVDKFNEVGKVYCQAA